ncbi:MAG TPA: electron transporter RnfD, partial [bacterium]|nr:electron transporter RnfD [bacterium]
MLGMKKGLIQWQLPMKRVLYALIPPALASIYFFGWRSLVILVIVNIAGFMTEFVFLRSQRQPVTSAVFVTNFIFALSLPPTIPYWMAVVGIVIGVLFGKMVFGGFGRNVFNPAMVGRAFLYVSFGFQMTGSWARPLTRFPGGILRFSTDALSQATPLVRLAEGTDVSWLRLVLGNVSGSFGEASAVLIVLGGLYIVWKKAASYQIVVSALLGMSITQTVFWLSGLPGAVDPLRALLAG